MLKSEAKPARPASQEAASTMSTNEKLKQDIIEQFGTPCAVIDLNIVDKNIADLQSLCDKANTANRPHIKTHKSPFWRGGSWTPVPSASPARSLGKQR